MDDLGCSFSTLLSDSRPWLGLSEACLIVFTFSGRMCNVWLLTDVFEGCVAPLLFMTLVQKCTQWST